jgi:hypothetical protein
VTHKNTWPTRWMETNQSAIHVFWSWALGACSVTNPPTDPTQFVYLLTLFDSRIRRRILLTEQAPWLYTHRYAHCDENNTICNMYHTNMIKIIFFFFSAGFACLPFLWAVNTIWFFSEAFRREQFQEQKAIKKCKFKQFTNLKLIGYPILEVISNISDEYGVTYRCFRGNISYRSFRIWDLTLRQSSSTGFCCGSTDMS